MTAAHGTQVKAQAAIESALAEIWSDVLGVANVDSESDFFALGGDSILSLQVVTKAQARGISLDTRMIFGHPTIKRLAASVQSNHARRLLTPARNEVPLTPIQSRFFATAERNVDQWNQWLLLDLRNPLRLGDLHRSVEQLFVAHDALRLKFRFRNGTWTQQYEANKERMPVEWVNLADSPAVDRRDTIDLLIQEANQGLKPENGNLIRFVYLDFGASSTHKLLIVAHHLIMDSVSFHLIVNDLDACLAQSAQGSTPRIEQNTCTYQAWSEVLTREAQSQRFDSEVDYWLAQVLPVQPLPCDYDTPLEKNTYASLRVCEIAFSEQQTSTIVYKLPTLLHCHINAILLAALANALCECFDLDEAVIDIESHGRHWIDDSIDLRKATGWYTSIYPQRVAHGGGRSMYDCTRALDRQLRAVPNNGMGYGVLRYLSKDGEAVRRLQELPPAQVCFNYLGQVGRGTRSLRVLNTENLRIGASHAGDLRRSQLLLVQSAVTAGTLKVQCHYNERLHREETVRGLLSRMQRNLNDLLPSIAAGLRRSLKPLLWDRAQERGMEEILQRVAVFYPLLGLQTSILFQHLSSPGGVPPYIVQVHCVLRGRLVTEAFEHAWRTVVARHESLRTSFHWDGLDAPVQAVHRDVAVAVKVLDWRHKDQIAQQTDLEALLRKDRRAGFVLDGAGPLMRIVVVAIEEDRNFCIWSHHHIQMDGWSQVLVLRELFQTYQALVAGESPDLPTAPSLGEYFRALDRIPSAEGESYWREYLRGFREPTPILTEGSGSEELRGGGESYREIVIRLSEAQSAAVQDFARASSLTLHTIFRAVWGFWLFVHSGRDEVVFGNVVSGRHIDMESVGDLVGTLINTIPVRLRLDEPLTVLDWLKRIQDEQVSSQRHELFPLGQTMKLAQTPQDQLLFQSILVFENLPGNYADIVAQAGLVLEHMDFRIQENYPLVVSIRPESAMTVRISYREDLVDPGILHVDRFIEITLAEFMQSGARSALACRNRVKQRYGVELKGSGEADGTQRPGPH